MTTTRNATAKAATPVTVLLVGKVDEFELFMADLLPTGATVTASLLAPAYYGKRVDVDPTYDATVKGSGDAAVWDAHKQSIRTAVDARQRALCMQHAATVKTHGTSALVVFVAKGALDFVADDVAPVFPDVANVDVVKAFLLNMGKRGVKVQYI